VSIYRCVCVRVHARRVLPVVPAAFDVCMCVYTCVYVCVSMFVYVCEGIYRYVCVCVCIQMCVFERENVRRVLSLVPAAPDACMCV